MDALYTSALHNDNHGTNVRTALTLAPFSLRCQHLYSCQCDPGKDRCVYMQDGYIRDGLSSLEREREPVYSGQ